MKLLKDISWQVEEPEYRADSALSYSTISKYEREGKFSSLATLRDEVSTPSLIFGSMVDTLITGSEEEFKEHFIVIDDPGISDNLKEIASKLYSMYGNTRLRFEDIPDRTLAEVGKECNYYAGDKYENYRIKMIKENCKPYFSTLRLAEGKTVVTSEDVSDARKCTDVLRNSSFTQYFFTPDNPFDNTVQRFYQLKS